MTRPDKILFPGERPLTKWDLVDYYRRIAGTMLPYVEGRPVTMQRFPDGIDGEGFFQKDVPAVAARAVPLAANPATAHLFIINPSPRGLIALFSTHQPTELRIARLLGGA